MVLQCILFPDMGEEVRQLDYGDTKLIFNGKEVTPEQWEALQEGHQQAMLNAEADIKQQWQLEDDSVAASILYLRSRSRWTWEKEAELVQRSRDGNPIPLSDVLSGEF